MGWPGRWRPRASRRTPSLRFGVLLSMRPGGGSAWQVGPPRIGRAGRPAIVCRAMNVRPDTAHTKGPLVFLDMDQQALDEAYDQEIYAPNRALVVERRKAASNQARAILGAPKRVT